MSELIKEFLDLMRSCPPEDLVDHWPHILTVVEILHSIFDGKPGPLEPDLERAMVELRAHLSGGTASSGADLTVENPLS